MVGSMIRRKGRTLKHYIGVIIALTFVIYGFMPTLNSLASSATISFTSKDTTISVGDKVAVALTVKSSANIGDFETFVSYDSNVLEFVEGGINVNGGDGLLKISDINTVDSEQSKKYVMTFKAINTGASEIAISDKAVVYDYDEGVEMSVSSNRLSINVKATSTASTNADLKSLKISPGSLSPNFDKDTTVYKTTVGKDVSSLIVSGTPEDSKAKVTVSNADKLSEGENKVTVTVKSESGTTKEYLIYVTRVSDNQSELASGNEDIKEEESDGDNMTDITEDGQEVENEDEQGVHVTNVEGEIVLTTSGKYIITEVTDETIIPKGYVKNQIMIDDIAVTVYTLEDDLENDFLLIYAKNSEGNEQFYQYDRIEHTVQRYTGDDQNKNESDESEVTKELTQEQYKNNLNQLWIVIAVLAGISVLLSLILIRIVMKRKGYKDDDLD